MQNKLTDRQRYNRLKKTAIMRNRAFWVEAEDYYYLNKHEYHKKHVGKSGRDSWAGWVGEIMDVPLSTVNFKTTLYKRYVIELEIPIDILQHIHTRKLQYAMKYIDKRNAANILEIASNPDHADYYSFEGFKEYIKELYK